MLKLINKHTTHLSIISYIKIYFIVTPFIFLIMQLVRAILEDEYVFHYMSIITTIIMNLIFISPLIFNSYKQNKKYKEILKIILKDNGKTDVKVKAIFNHNQYIKGNSYDLSVEYTMDNNPIIYLNYDKLKNIINKFEIDDIKTIRQKKLKRLKRRFLK